MRWTLTGAEAMLHVRSVCASSAWDELGAFGLPARCVSCRKNQGLTSDGKSSRMIFTTLDSGRNLLVAHLLRL